MAPRKYIVREEKACMPTALNMYFQKDCMIRFRNSKKNKNLV